MADFLDRINMQKKPKEVINLQKKGDSCTINLIKSHNELLFNLNWEQKVRSAGQEEIVSAARAKLFRELDLDLACIYRLKDGSQGLVQALGNHFVLPILSLIVTIEIKRARMAKRYALGDLKRLKWRLFLLLSTRVLQIGKRPKPLLPLSNQITAIL